MSDYVVPVLPRRPRSAYINVPDRIRKRTSAKTRGWFAGWPDNCPAASARQRVVVMRPQDGRQFSVSVDKRLAVLVESFLTMSMDVGYPLIGTAEVNTSGKKQGGNGSFVCRAIKGVTPPQPSNHSTGTALDLYTRSNPQRWGDPIPFTSTIHPLMVELAAAGDLYWGGWYWDSSNHEYVDAMHFEYMRRPENVADSLARMKARYKELATPPEPEPEVPVTPEQIKVLQAKLNEVGTSPPLTIDGVYGPMTETAVVGLPALVTGQVDTAEDAARAETKADAVEAVEAI